MHNLTIVIPIRNEAESLPKVISGLAENLSMLDYQILVIDDGCDNTKEALNQLHLLDTNVQYIKRPLEKQNGLAGAIVDGVKIGITNSKFVVTMDGDGQHPPEVVLQMFWCAESTKADMVMASRHIDGGSTNGLDGNLRRIYSNLLGKLPRIVFPLIRNVTDPLAGFFLLRSDCIRLENIRPIGWKASLEFLLFSSIEIYEEVGYEFKARIGGESKANATVALEYFLQLASLAFRYYTQTNWRKECPKSSILTS